MPIIISTTSDEEAQDVYLALAAMLGRPFRVYVRGREFTPAPAEDAR